MRIHLQIFSALFIIIFAFLQAKPFIHLGNSIAKHEGSKEHKAMQCCSKMKMKCSAPMKEKDEDKNCENNGCNPLLPCSVGFCCYVVENFISYNSSYTVFKQQLPYFDDNRISQGLTECWHPPELVS